VYFSSRVVKDTGTGIAFTNVIKYAKRCQAMKSLERTVITKEHASSLQPTSSIKLQFPSAKDNVNSQPQTQKKGRPSIIDSGDNYAISKWI